MSASASVPISLSEASNSTPLELSRQHSAVFREKSEMARDEKVEFLREELLRYRRSHGEILEQLLTCQAALDAANSAKAELADALCEARGAPGRNEMEGVLLRKKLQGKPKARASALAALAESPAGTEDGSGDIASAKLEERLARVEAEGEALLINLEAIEARATKAIAAAIEDKAQVLGEEV